MLWTRNVQSFVKKLSQWNDKINLQPKKMVEVNHGNCGNPGNCYQVIIFLADENNVSTISLLYGF